jgi:RNA polymerase-binding transcription factor DksA
MPKTAERQDTPETVEYPLPAHVLGELDLALERERARVVKRVRGLEAAARELGEGQHEESGFAGQAADVATELAEEEVLLGLEQADREHLAEIDAAIERMRTGRYGLCERCDRPIYLPRLQSLPWARYCHGCASHLVAERTRAGAAARAGAGAR